MLLIFGLVIGAPLGIALLIAWGRLAIWLDDRDRAQHPAAPHWPR